MAQTSFIHANEGILFAEDVSLEAIANQFGTPTYIYSKNTLIQTFESFKNPCPTPPLKIFIFFGKLLKLF
jgi:diaminopimelate decarboxylase